MSNMEIIKCERCQTRFRVSRDLIKETGTAVRCSNCQNVFTVFKTMPEEEYGPEDLDRRLESLLEDDEADLDGDGKARAERGAPRLKARLPRPAKTNPISLITGDGDNFIVADEPPRKPQADLAGQAPPQFGQSAMRPPSPPSFGQAPPSPIPGTLQGASKGQPPPPPIPGAFPVSSQGLAPPPIPESYQREAPSQTWPPQSWPPPPQANGDLGLGDDPLSPMQTGSPAMGPGQPWPPPPEPFAPQGGPPYPQGGSPEGAYQGEASQGFGFQGGQAPPQAPLRTKKGRTFSKRQKILALVLSVLAVFLVVWTLFMGGSKSAPPPPAPSASASAGAPPPSTGEALSAPSSPDVLNLNFLKEQNTHHYLTHPEAGQLLVIVGRIRNAYDKPISHIRVKGSLKNSEDQILSERQVFAGNYLSEDVIKSLSMREILGRLSLRGGENGSNLNIQPGQDVPFMLVFDKLPPDVAEYIVEPMDYTAADAP